VLIPLVITTAPGLPLMLPLPLMLALHLGCFFAVAMVCHGELARQRPPTAQLTEFYFFLSIGGVLGGAFNALLAPLIFSSVWEYPLALIAACLVKPSAPDDARHGLTRDVLLPFALVGLVLLTNAIRSIVADGTVLLLLVATFGYMLPALALLNFSPRRWRFALGVAVMLFATAPTGASDTIAAYRSFFGVYRIRAVDDRHSHALVLMNGTTLHGVRSLVPGEEALPMAYYNPQGRSAGSLRRSLQTPSGTSRWSGWEPAASPVMPVPGSIGRSMRSIPSSNESPAIRIPSSSSRTAAITQTSCWAMHGSPSVLRPTAPTTR
jgi:hypothetical protein